MGVSVNSRTLSNFYTTQKTKILFVGVFVVIGSVFLFVTHAATPTVSNEVENGTLNGATVVSDTNASGGKAVKFGASSSAIPTQTTTQLPINLPTQAWLKKGITSKTNDKLVFAHYFTQFTLSESNGSDYYANNYLPPNGEGGAHVAYGGYLRERPLPVGYTTTSTYLVDDMKTEVTRATTAGLDGFAVDILSTDTTGYHWDRIRALIQAVKAVDPNFKLMLMPDSYSFSKKATPPTAAQVAQALSTVASDSTMFKLPDGRLVVSVFDPEAQGAAYWQSVIAAMKNTYGITVAFVPCFNNYGANVAAFASFSYGLSEWGGRSPKVSNNIADNGVDAHNRGKIWMQPVSYQDERPSQASYAEAQNGDNYRITWASAMSSDADWVQIPTWNDYSEEAEIAPSTHHGYSLLDLTSYYLTKFKMGQDPPIVRDIAYVSHRIQKAGASVTNETKPMVLRNDSSAARDYVEIATFLTGSATVTVKIGSNTYTYTAPAGASQQTYPLAAGNVSVNVSRGGTTVATVNSPYAISTGSVAYQDLHYYYISSVASRNPPAGY